MSNELRDKLLSAYRGHWYLLKTLSDGSTEMFSRGYQRVNLEKHITKKKKRKRRRR